MGAFNELEQCLITCQRCHGTFIADVQFKFGNCWGLRYRIGDKVGWGGNDYGPPGKRRVVVIGSPPDCPICKSDPGDVDIFFENDAIREVRPHSPEFTFHIHHECYIVLEE